MPAAVAEEGTATWLSLLVWLPGQLLMWARVHSGEVCSLMCAVGLVSSLAQVTSFRKLLACLGQYLHGKLAIFL